MANNKKIFLLLVLILLLAGWGSLSLATTEISLKRVLLPVPFQSQAPFGNWGMPWKEGCEEASIVLVQTALQQKKLTPHDMSQEILKLVVWQNKEWGTHKDLTAQETMDLAQKNYQLKFEIKEKPTINDLKKILRDRRLVIVPTAGRLLKNPYFKQPGPVYHMVVLRGYDDKKGVFIVNDVGTRRGEAYQYKYSVFMKAIHDWPGSENKMLTGVPRVLVTEQSL